MAARKPEEAVRQFASKVQRRAVLVKKRIAFDLYNRVTAKTPVDTGRARASWNLSVNEQDLSTATGGASKSGHGRSSPPRQPVVRAPSLASLAIGPGDVVWISNNVPYIRYLEGGSSTQAPHGMVAVSIREVLASLPDYVRGAIDRS